ncbi:MAG: hypothetical protein ACI35R_09865 [Bacillus sp. (in: firmicutes)]
MTLHLINKTKEDIQAELLYIKQMEELLKEVDFVLEKIEDAYISERHCFMAVNPKTNQEEAVPVKRALHFLQYACGEAFPAIEPPKQFQQEHELCIYAFDCLQTATRLMGFYFHNESFATDQNEQKICFQMDMYNDTIAIFLERIEPTLDKLMQIYSMDAQKEAED